MTTYRIREETIRAEDASLQDALARAYPSKVRPLCLCRPGGVEMYIAKVPHSHGVYAIKRMPDTGSDHSPECDAYDPPPELSGLGQVMGAAIQEDPDQGVTALKLDFSLTKLSGRQAPVGGGLEVDSVKTDGNKLSLRGMLHYLWDQAEFTRWLPRMAGRRSWFVIRKYLLQAAQDKTTKRASLGDLLYIPESFDVERKAEITQRRIAAMTKGATPAKGSSPLMLVIGEVKEVAPSRYGHKIVFKHLPDCHFMMNEDLHKRLLKRFAVELELWDAFEDTHLIAIGTFGLGPTGVPSLNEVALMTGTADWIPFENAFDKLVVDAMVAEGRRFQKGLRYNLPSNRPLASLVASDTLPEPTAMYVVPPGVSEDYEATLADLMDTSKLPHWIWRAGETGMPPLPAFSLGDAPK